MRSKFSMPFKDLMPMASQEDARLLQADIAINGVREPVQVSEDGEVLAGHRRYECDPDAEVHVIEGSKAWTKAEKQAFVLKHNTLRRNLDPAGKEYLKQSQASVAFALKAEGKKQEDIARHLGVTQQRVSELLSSVITGTGNNTTKKQSLSTKDQAAEAKRLSKQGKTQEQIAQSLGVSRPTVSNLLSGKTAGVDRPASAYTGNGAEETTDSETEGDRDDRVDTFVATLGRLIMQSTDLAPRIANRPADERREVHRVLRLAISALGRLRKRLRQR
jgi:predicted transcriptional regulator